ncbi:Uncharacterized protein conserved in bacteria [Listeria grayi]|uniref:Protein CsbA n=3 Tax=Listeria grayi TaxID=1641 RepID=D7UW75_LISGR|nr:hypothetical protein HMPREF0556_11356 [Listeria grayi DSM 20601]EUJ28307.1 hypothetical protein LMUR_07094 [Listeria grayi FSL F6-1183]STY44392.1 Uncharacterized protein conserved in bacteria [Listeria grayi]VEI36290.1 Uncharacterized protein conserved in bacteria [Listeria grayi]
MIDQLISAFILPCLLVVVFARITYSRYVGLILMVGLIAASSKLGYTDTWWLIVIDAFSMTVGFYLATVMLRKLKERDNL